MTPLNQELRELCAWFEWGSQPHFPVIAEVLQDAADAAQVCAMSLEAAAVLIQVWGHFVGREAAVGNPPPTYGEAERVEVLRYTAQDLLRMFDGADETDKPRLATLLREQNQTLKRHERKLQWPT